MALLTASEAKEAITGLTGTAEDALLDKLIAAVGVAIAIYCGYPRASATADATVESTSYTLYSGGNNGRIKVNGGKLLLPVRPVTAVTNVYDDVNQSYATAVTSTDYTTDAVDGVIRLLPNSTQGAWSTSEYAIKAVVTAGYSTLPTDIKLAARLCVRHWWELRSRGPSEQISAEGVSLAPQSIAIPKQAKDLLNPYRLARGWVA